MQPGWAASIAATMCSVWCRWADCPRSTRVSGRATCLGNTGGQGVVGYARGRSLGGLLRERQRAIFIRQDIANRVPALAGPHVGTGRTVGGLASFERTGAHEFGHTLGLDHPPPGTVPGNLMHQTLAGGAGLEITEAQVMTVETEFNTGRLNGSDQGVDPQVFPF
jgi:hypothetical protein